MDKQTLVSLFQYHYSAQRQLWSEIMMLSEEQFTHTEPDSATTLRSQLVHMMANENLWINYLWHNNIEFLQEAQFPTRSMIQLEWDALEEEIIDYIDGLTPEELEREFVPPFCTSKMSFKVWEALITVFNQAARRRHWILTNLEQFGATPLMPDFLDYLFQKPESLAAS